MSNMDFSEQWKSIQKMFLPTSVFSEPYRDAARRFWENQAKILDNMQAFTNHWFEHRQTGVHSAQEAVERMCTESVTDQVQAYQDWTKGVFERMMADCVACQQQIVAATGAFTSPSIAPSPEKKVEPVRPEVKAPTRSKTT